MYHTIIKKSKYTSILQLANKPKSAEKLNRKKIEKVKNNSKKLSTTENLTSIRSIEYLHIFSIIFGPFV